MLGVAPLQRIEAAPWKGPYDPEFSDKVYAELFRRAAVVLSSGRPVVLDASFRTAAWREAARRVALAHGVPFRFVECHAPRDVCLARLAARERQPSVSDGRSAIFDEFTAGYEPVLEIAAEEHFVVDTTNPLEQNLESLRQCLPGWPRGLSG